MSLRPSFLYFQQVAQLSQRDRAAEWVSYIGGFRDTYLGRQVVLRPGGPRAGMGSAGGLRALRAPLAGSGAEPQPKSKLLPFSLKISHQVATISIIFHAMQTTNFKVKNIWGGNASPCL